MHRFSREKLKQKIGPVVQLVRIHACHAWGRGFESRPDRKKASGYSGAFLFFDTQVNVPHFNPNFSIEFFN